MSTFDPDYRSQFVIDPYPRDRDPESLTRNDFKAVEDFRKKSKRKSGCKWCQGAVPKTSYGTDGFLRICSNCSARMCGGHTKIDADDTLCPECA